MQIEVSFPSGLVVSLWVEAKGFDSSQATKIQMEPAKKFWDDFSSLAAD